MKITNMNNINRIKKIVAILIVIILSFNFLLANGTVFATEKEKSKEPQFSEGIVDDLINEGKVRRNNQDDASLDVPPVTLGLGTLVINILSKLFSYIASAVNFLYNTFFYNTIPEENKTAINKKIEAYNFDDKYEHNFKLDTLFFNDTRILDANFFNVDRSPTSGNVITNNIKTNVAKTYVMISGLALILSLVIFIYAVIKLILVYAGLKTVKEEITIKKLLTNVAKSVVLLFLLPVILALISYAVDALIKLLNYFRLKLLEDMLKANGNVKAMDFETRILDMKFNSSKYKQTINLIDIGYVLLVMVQTGFIITYLKRFYTIGLLTMVSPLITITYVLDKFNDDRSDVLARFFREYTYTLLIMPIHGLMYLIFMFGASDIASVSPLFGVLIVMLLGRAEKTIKGILDARDLTVVRSSEEYLKRLK